MKKLTKVLLLAGVAAAFSATDAFACWACVNGSGGQECVPSWSGWYTCDTVMVFDETWCQFGGGNDCVAEEVASIASALDMTVMGTFRVPAVSTSADGLAEVACNGMIVGLNNSASATAVGEITAPHLIPEELRI